MKVNLEGFSDMLVDKWWQTEKNKLKESTSTNEMCKAVGLYVAEHIVSMDKRYTPLPITEAHQEIDKEILKAATEYRASEWYRLEDRQNYTERIGFTKTDFIVGAKWMFDFLTRSENANKTERKPIGE